MPSIPHWPGYYPPYSPAPRSHKRSDPTPSSDPPEEVEEDVRVFPRISDWLVKLDSGPLGEDGHHFAQYRGFFEEQMYL
jgi:hypothetical protein